MCWRIVIGLVGTWRCLVAEVAWGLSGGTAKRSKVEVARLRSSLFFISGLNESDMTCDHVVLHESATTPNNGSYFRRCFYRCTR